MLLWYLIWIGTLFLSTTISSYYIKKRGRPDAIIALYCVYLALSQIVAAKIASFSIGITFVAAGGAMLYPFLYQLNDVTNEYFGEQETRRMIFIAFATQVFMVMALYLSINIPPAQTGFPQETWETLLWSGIRITGASWVAFLITNNLDAWLYPRIKQLTRGKHLWLRNAGSDAISLTLDSLIFIPLAFAGQLSPPTEYPLYSLLPSLRVSYPALHYLLTLIIGHTVTKYFFGLVDTPFLYLSRYIIGEEVTMGTERSEA